MTQLVTMLVKTKEKNVIIRGVFSFNHEQLYELI